jgi:hypothetical protein
MAEAFAPDDQQLAGKVAIVAGAGAAEGGIGNGRAASILLARAGAKSWPWTGIWNGRSKLYR